MMSVILTFDDDLCTCNGVHVLFAFHVRHSLRQENQGCLLSGVHPSDVHLYLILDSNRALNNHLKGSW